MAEKTKLLSAQATKLIRDYAVKECEAANVPVKAAADILLQLHNEREEQIDLFREIPVFWTEGLAALARVMEREFGTTRGATKNPLNGADMPKPGSMLSIPIAPGEQVNLSQDWIALPGLPIIIKPMWDGPFQFKLFGKMKRLAEPKFQSFCESVLDEVRKASIYRSKMLEMRFEWDGDEDVMQPPGITEPPQQSPEDLILPALTHGYITTELFQFVKHAETNRKHKLAMNRKVLLAGSYGTGKTLTAGVLANVATKAGWTYMWFKPTAADTRDPFACLRKVLEMAQQYQPCIVFMEDIDELLGRERDSRVNEVVNTLDGLVGKRAEILFVATTNTPEALDPVTLRRFDLLVSFELPDADAVQRLVRLYAGSILKKSEKLDEVGVALAGKAPSIIQSAVESAKRAAVYRAADYGTEPVLMAHDILVAAEGRRQHVSLIDRPPRVDRDPVEQVADAIVKASDIMVSGKANGHLTPTTSVRAY